MFEFIDFECMHLNIKWVFLTWDNIQDCIRRWWCDLYYDLYDQSDETEKEAHDCNVCERLFRWYTQHSQFVKWIKF
jgi:hypothetical protein